MRRSIYTARRQAVIDPTLPRCYRLSIFNNDRLGVCINMKNVVSLLSQNTLIGQDTNM